MIAFVTGATAGFGAAIARRFAKEGHRVVAAGRRAERLAALREELGRAVHTVVLDVRDRAAVLEAFKALPPAFAEVDVLVNNAGLALGLEPAQKANLDDWDRMVDTNVKGLLYCTRAALDGMVARNRGHIINIGSIAAEFPYAGGHVYSATKAFVHQFGLSVRADLLGTAVRLTDVQPGMVAGTEFSEVRFKGDQARAQQVYQGTEPLTAEDIADCVYWAATRPAHVNVNTIQVMPVCQAPGRVAIHRKETP
ncbi:MAG TPA: SDR family NAD(P)-dependent oxidoreductase [Usitatibacteraceae bacterium]|nr:SDR family NAD(P)-dependent oxidoreductase [Usitatibacteraceae bacterium]